MFCFSPITSSKVFFSLFVKRHIKTNDNINIQNDIFPLSDKFAFSPEGSNFPSVSLKWLKPKPSKSLVLRYLHSDQTAVVFKVSQIICQGHMCFTCQVTYMGSVPPRIIRKKTFANKWSEAMFPNSCYGHSDKSYYCKPLGFRAMFPITQKEHSFQITVFKPRGPVADHDDTQ